MQQRSSTTWLARRASRSARVSASALGPRNIEANREGSAGSSWSRERRRQKDSRESSRHDGNPRGSNRGHTRRWVDAAGAGGATLIFSTRKMHHPRGGVSSMLWVALVRGACAVAGQIAFRGNVGRGHVTAPFGLDRWIEDNSRSLWAIESQPSNTARAPMHTRRR
jgi:hypothetical protein